MRRADEFTKLRPLLYAIAYRILGDTRAAQYAVQAAWLRWMAAPAEPASVEGHLAAEVTRIAVRSLQSARVARGEVVGPLLADSGLADPDRPAELADSLSLSALMVLERLSPLERAVFVLREAFGCGDERIAAALGCSEEACRQLLAAVATVSDGGVNRCRGPRVWRVPRTWRGYSRRSCRRSGGWASPWTSPWWATGPAGSSATGTAPCCTRWCSTSRTGGRSVSIWSCTPVGMPIRWPRPARSSARPTGHAERLRPGHAPGRTPS